MEVHFLNQSEVVNLIITTINTIFSNLFASIDNSIYANLDNVTFIGPDVIANSFFEKLLGANGKNGLIYITDALLLAICIYYVVRLFYSNYMEINVEKPSQFLFKLLVFALFINFSYFLCEQILNINYLISCSIQEVGKNILGCDISFSELIFRLSSNVSFESGSLDIFSLNGLIKSFISVGLVNLLFTYSLRNIIVQIFVLFSPFAILSLINSSSSWLFKSWAKCFFSLLVLQHFIPLVIIVIFSIDDSNKILLLAGICALMQINTYVREMFGGIGVQFSHNASSMISYFKKG